MYHCSLLCRLSKVKWLVGKGFVVGRKRGKQHGELHRRNNRGYRNSIVD
jgi:hypothetical protein